MTLTYVGRFAPSPTGPLHIGSLTTAVASYLHARQAGGRWLVRMENIDPPREAPGAADVILRTLEAYELHWDGPVLYQSARLKRYERITRGLLQQGAAFLCSCTRRELRARGPVYPGTCRGRSTHTGATAVRVRLEAAEGRAGPYRAGALAFEDVLQGPVTFRAGVDLSDYVIRRRDRLPAYHLAVVADDAAQQVTDIVRGSDLLESTGAHLHLQQLLGLPQPRYSHLPVVVNTAGQKLSKQTGAGSVAAASARSRSALACAALEYLGLRVPPALKGESPGALWSWAKEEWRIERLRGLTRLSERAVVGRVEMD